MSDPLREALTYAERETAVIAVDLHENGMHPDDAAEALAKLCQRLREALAAAPEPSYEWRICGRQGQGGQWEGLARRSEPEWREMQERRTRNQEVWLERRAAVVGPWERVEVEDGEG